ncbi:AAA family ATPase [Pyxidicoccus fallax]|uniref:Serine/threonine-protein kinase PknK n=1 Tax=Pyxidicoccus fallax TaxID=394095 RepID=A0A848LS02_9BACT|nr:AAA family ATPase [Pyxidicoccus fallax]NMO20536.1 serine/threonine-protein kinase PknK [Pyxidicoccus fallax]NPC82101.1 AAA family ATPase [Pyxidicoccus fallax]
MEPVKTGSTGSDRTGPDTELLTPGQRLGRYEVVERVGAGGMGVVYKARDTVRGNTVALKTLHRLEPGALLRLKNEFRYVANVTHRNLVSLHELMEADDKWFFTMEFIEGESLWSLLHRGAQQAASTSDAARSRSEDTVTVTRDAQAVSKPTVTSERPSGNTPATSTTDVTVTQGKLSPSAPLVVPPPGPTLRPAQPVLPIDELRRIFGELALGIFALHSSRKFHCDIKPRNVMVEKTGRVVLLDFGLASDRSEPSTGELAGTPAYISPEQLMGQPSSEATDWYAFGVMLYEALAGGQSFRRGNLREQVHHAPPPLEPSPLVPEELRTLAMDLVQVEPSRRPTGPEVLRRLGLTVSAPAAPRVKSLVGREGPLAALLSAYDAMAAGRTVVAHLHGPSGMGKTALVRSFAEGLGAKRPGSVVLSGRCYERESVPYKGFDSLIDALTRYLRTLPQPVMKTLVPQHLPELLRIFPVLRQVESFSKVAPISLEASREQQELRLRAFRALKELLAKLGNTAPLVLHLDDLQWGDADTAQALSELQEAPGTPRMLLLCGYRTGEGIAAGLLEAHRKLATAPGNALDLRELVLDPLSETEGRELAAALVGTDAADARAATLAREARGSPFFIEALAQYVLEQGEAAPLAQGGLVTLEQVVQARVGKLAPEPARLLAAVAVAGQPVPRGLAFRAAALDMDPHTPWTQLRASHLVTTHGPRDEDLAECYHDRIRETVHASLAPDALKANHLRLAELLEETGSAEPDRLARHYKGAGRLDKAGPYAARAADRAASALAFDRAAALYAEALECTPDDADLLEKWADALVNAGRGAEAAPLYVKAASLVRGNVDRAFDLRRRGTEQYLVNGMLDEGAALLKQLLAEVKLPYPASPPLTLAGIIFHSIQFVLFGKRVRNVSPGAVPPLLRRRVNLTWSAARGLAVQDMLRMGYFAVRNALLSAQAGDEVRTTYGLLGLTAVTFARGSAGDEKRGHRYLEESTRRVEAANNPALTGFFKYVHGSIEMMLGNWRRADTLLAEGIRILEDECTGVIADLDQTYSCRVYVLRMLGELRELAAIGNRWLRFSEQNQNRYATGWMHIHLTSTRLAEDAPAEALSKLEPQANGWNDKRFTPQHLYAVLESARCELYQDAPAAAWTRLGKAWPVAESNFVLGHLYFRIYALRVRAGTALAMAASRPAERERFLAMARKDMVELERTSHRTDARVEARLLRATEAALVGKTADAIRLLEGAEADYQRLEMPLHAASLRRRRGQLTGGEAGARLITEADAILKAAGIRDPARWVTMEAPGFPAK